MWDRKDPLSFSSMFLFFFFSHNIGGSIEPDAGVKKEENEKITKCLSNQAWIYNPRRYTSDENGVPFGKFSFIFFPIKIQIPFFLIQKSFRLRKS